jgi:hypothetical protein
MKGRVVIAPPFQVLQTLLAPTSVLRSNPAGVNVILVRWADLTHQDRLAASASAPAEDLAAALRCSANENRVPHLVILCSSAPPSDRSSKDDLHGDWDDQLIRAFDTHPNVLVMTAGEIQLLYRVVYAHDRYGDDLAAIPYTPSMFAAMGTTIARKYHM